MRLVSLLTPRATTSTHLPYTTLFRSQVEPVSFLGIDVEAHARMLGCEAQRQQALGHDRQHLVLVREDRKSTRLNSSHVEISYAVFCLKKKNGRDIAVVGCNFRSQIIK